MSKGVWYIFLIFLPLFSLKIMVGKSFHEIWKKNWKQAALWKFCPKVVIWTQNPCTCGVQIYMTCYTLYNPIVQRDFKYHMEVVGVPFTCLLLCIFFHRLRSSCVRKYRNLLSFRTNMTVKGLILWWSESNLYKMFSIEVKLEILSF